MDASTRDFGLRGAGKGDAPRNISKKFFENFDAIDFGYTLNEAYNVDFDKGFKRRGNKLTKKYK